MLYYLEMPKIGKVFSSTNRYAYLDYAVNPRWITGWLQGKEISSNDVASVIVFYWEPLFVSFACEKHPATTTAFGERSAPEGHLGEPSASLGVLVGATWAYIL